MFSIIDLKDSKCTNLKLTGPYLFIGKGIGGSVKNYYYFYRPWTPQVFKRASLIEKIIQKYNDDQGEYIKYYRDRDIETVPNSFGGLNLVLKLYTSKDAPGGNKYVPHF